MTCVLDSGRISQAIDNLLTNAIKFTPAGGRIELGVERDGDEVAIRVADDGVGIPAADQPRLFERFFRSANAPDDPAGVGLGLAIVKAIVEGHGGSISLDSQVGVGTTFRIVLPLATAAAARDSDGAGRLAELAEAG
jgi:signal transduction histidine kinase